MTTASELIPSLIAQVLSRGLKEKLNPVYFSRLLLLAMNFSSWRNMESASAFPTCVYTVVPCRGEEWKRGFPDPVKSQVQNTAIISTNITDTKMLHIHNQRQNSGVFRADYQESQKM